MHPSSIQFWAEVIKENTIYLRTSKQGKAGVRHVKKRQHAPASTPITVDCLQKVRHPFLQYKACT
eukprot:scaffold5970_cov26-Tisochrysis_lutea.AAC.1